MTAKDAKGKTVILTGNAGFIGSYLTEALLKEDYQVRGLDIRPRTDSIRGFSQMEGNILDKAADRKAMEGADCVIHLAAEHKDFGVTPEQYHTVNVEGTKTLLKAASEMEMKKFIFYSSVAVYGGQSNTTEETVPVPNNPYGTTKLAAEGLVRAWAAEDPARTVVIIRPAVVFGPHSKANIFRLMRQVCDGTFLLVGDGTNIKSIAYVANLVDATIYLMERCSGGIQTFNYAEEPHLQTKDLVHLMQKIAGRRQSRFYLPLNLAVAGGFGFDLLGKITGIDFPVTVARMRKFTVPTYHRAERIRAFGFVPKHSIEEGLKKNIEWYMGKRKS
jgi:nucleoside-diphosphate-sugar epimerase